jgi:hypothetical protein
MYKQPVHTNSDRAHAAEAVLIAYASSMESRRLEALEDSRQSNDEWLIDLLTDLRHWARGAGLDFDEYVRLSADHCQCEVDDEEGGAE